MEQSRDNYKMKKQTIGSYKLKNLVHARDNETLGLMSGSVLGGLKL